MGIFSRIFQRGQDGDPIDGSQGEQDSEGGDSEGGRSEARAPERGEALADGTPEPAEMEEELTRPVSAATPALAAAAAGPAPASSPFQTPLWSWPQRSSDTNPTAPTPSAARQESPMAKPDDPASPAPRQRSPLPGLPKRTPTAQPAVAPPAPASTAPPAPAPAPAPAAPAGAPKDKDRNDATVVMSPPPAPAGQRTMPTPRSSPVQRGAATSPQAPAAAPAPAPAKAPAPTPVSTSASTPETPRRKHPDTETRVLDEVVMEIQSESVTGAIAALMSEVTAMPAPEPAAAATPEPEPAKAPGSAKRQSENAGFTPEDLASVRSVFNDVAVGHVAQVRDVMLELRYGDTNPKWIEMTKPALRSLRQMAAQMELADLCDALDAFCAAADAVVQSHARLTDEDNTELQRRYARLIELIPQAFELDAERDRREPIIVEALLSQVPGVEQPTIQKLLAVGLGRLDALMNAKADEVAVVTGLRPELAQAIVEQFRSYRANASAAVSAPDPAAELRQLHDLLIMLSLQNDDYTRASGEWSDEAQQRKRTLRKQREQTFQQIKVALARLGERDQLQRLEKLSFQDRIATIDRYLSSQQVRPST